MDEDAARAGLVPFEAGTLPRVLVVGGSCLSVLVHAYPVPGHPVTGGVHVHTAVGCMGPGKALNLLRLGFPTSLHTVLGDDQPGARVRALLAAQGLPIVADLDPEGTNTHVNVMAADGGRVGIPIIRPSRAPVVDVPRLAAAVGAADLVVLNPHDVCRQAMPAIRRSGTPVWADLGDLVPGDPYFDPFRAVADVVTMSGERIPDQPGLLEALIAEGKSLAVITNGARGSVALSAAGDWVHTPAVPDCPMVDTNGAGDSFHAGLLFGVATGRPLAEALQVATVVAGLTVSSGGPVPSRAGPGSRGAGAAALLPDPPALSRPAAPGALGGRRGGPPPARAGGGRRAARPTGRALMRADAGAWRRWGSRTRRLW